MKQVMNKNELKTRLIIAQGELNAEIDNEYGCFDEIAERIFLVALSCEALLDKSSEDVEIQFDKSIKMTHCGEPEFIDGIYLSTTATEAHISASSEDNSEIYCYDIEEIVRDDIVRIVKELIKMC